MTDRKMVLSILAALLLTASFAPCQAQDEPMAKRNVISVNPFLAAFGWYTGEYERVVSDKYTIGVSGTYLSVGDDDDGATYSGADITPRLYPQENAPGGLFFGGRLGFRQVEETVTEFLGDTVDTSTVSFTAAGFEIGFTYLFGVDENYAVSVGIGVVKLFGGDLEEESTTLPTVRVINLGFAF